MVKTIIKAIYSAFISIAIIAIILTGWTSYAFISQSSKSSELINVIQDMYSSQKSFVIDVIDLSKLLIKDTSESIAKENNNLSVENELLADLDEKSQLDQSQITEDNGSNPLGIVIEPSSSEVSENKLPEMNLELLVNQQNEFSMNENEMDMN